MKHNRNTLRPGGAQDDIELINSPLARKDDNLWFDARPNRLHRLREPSPEEAAVDPRCTCVLVRRIALESGGFFHLKRPLRLPRAHIDALACNETACSRLFGRLMAHFPIAKFNELAEKYCHE